MVAALVVLLLSSAVSCAATLDANKFQKNRMSMKYSNSLKGMDGEQVC